MNLTKIAIALEVIFFFLYVSVPDVPQVVMLMLEWLAADRGRVWGVSLRKKSGFEVLSCQCVAEAREIMEWNQ